MDQKSSPYKKVWERDRDMIRSPEKWPQRPFLPVKRKSKSLPMGLECGIIYEHEGLSSVTICNLFMLPKTIEEFKARPSYMYMNVEELLNDGWVVD